MSTQVFYLERPSFWTEVRDPECWYRGLEVLADIEHEQGVIHGTPRSLWQKYLKQVMSRRSILGLFGMSPDNEQNFLLGAGFLEFNSKRKGWQLSSLSKPLITDDQQSKSGDKEALRRLGMFLLKKSPWIRLLIFRLMQGDWSLSGWRSLRDGSGKLKAGSSLVFHRHAEQNDWFANIEIFCIRNWIAAESQDIRICLHPKVTERETRRDNFSWAPFKAPLYLFDYLGWMSNDGDLRIPSDVLKITGMNTLNNSPVNARILLDEITEKEADLRGLVAVEKVLRELHRKIYPGKNIIADEFSIWMDSLMSCALEKGAIEILATEPGQARHGRGLFGDRQRKLVRWVIHDDFKDCLFEMEEKIMKKVGKDHRQGVEIKLSEEQ